MKIIDWNAFWLSLLQSFVGVIFLCASDADRAGFRVFGGLLVLFSLFQITQALRGAIIDEEHVHFHSYMIRRKIDLSEIRAANCEFGVRFSPMLLFALAGGGSGNRRDRRSGSMALRSYLVNLSGDFGSAQVRFYNKRWRDAFLMALRDRAPRCRITRWS